MSSFLRLSRKITVAKIVVQTLLQCSKHVRQFELGVIFDSDLEKPVIARVSKLRRYSLVSTGLLAREI